MADNEHYNFAIRFHRTPYTCFYMCRSCRNHIVSYENRFVRNRLLDAIVCKNPVNVRAEKVESVWIPGRRAVEVDVFCKECNSVLGQKFFSVITRLAGIPVVQGETFILNLNKMLLWNGFKVVYADTLQPVDDNSWIHEGLPK